MRFKAPDLATAQHWANVLDAAGVGCELHNCYASGALGGLPLDACLPELWLDDERDEALARRLIAAASLEPAPGALPWRCAHCGEMLDPQFTACWHCGTGRDPRDG
ncbi:putative signal transducing protein [Burkholderia sp. TSV86]|uniref:putative signal transducing protein n=1 Tax=Burkholderia sp. TSV86 TaxID=1385594 RepID=UPI0007577D20|nr:DUF2007 domain-containing protein [Burkholderia sp. TSV86]KVE34244.1 hypothetical protein WS68_10480 [Burkholderia sp. TSV86]